MMQGYNGSWMNMHQAEGISLNAKFKLTSFVLAPEDSRSKEVVEVKGLAFLSDGADTVETPG